MKRIVLLIAFCLSLSALYAQTIDIVHLKSGLDARGTITEQTESKITIKTETGQTLSFNMDEIASMEQEEKAFDPKVLIGRWACYKASGERDRTYDMEISENEGFYTVSYNSFVRFKSEDNSVCFLFDSRCIPTDIGQDSKDIDVSEGNVFYRFELYCDSWIYANTRKEYTAHLEQRTCDINLKYIDGKLKGSIDCSWVFKAWGTSGYRFIEGALADGHGSVDVDGPGGKWNVYFVKY